VYIPCRPSHVRLSGGGVWDVDRRIGQNSGTFQYEYDTALCPVLGATYRKRDAEDERKDIFKYTILTQ